MGIAIILILYNFISGTACLIFGVKLLSIGLEKASSKAIEKFLSLSTKNILFGFITGTLSTAMIQSSTAVTVITVGLVNSGLMQLPQAMGIIYGANIGTTITAHLISVNLTAFSMPVLILGIILWLFSHKHTSKNLSLSLIGFGFMLIGICILNSGIPYVKQNPLIYRILKTYGQNPFIAVLIGIITTMLLHSSSAAVGLTVVLFNAGLINLDSAIGLMLGDNIGTCMTAQLASIGMSIAAKRVAYAHTMYNVIGSIAVLCVLIPFRTTVEHITFALGHDKIMLVANAHTIFNVLSASVFLPITHYYIKFIEWLLPEQKR